jgi:diguanylate cyclase (GGDEF)-like protein/PAS domain S-box-containing protein
MSVGIGSPPRARRRSRPTAGLIACIAGLVGVAVHWRWSGGPVGEWSYLLVGSGAGAVAWLGARRQLARGPRLVALGIALSAAGDFLWQVFEWHGRAPLVSVADIGWVAAYVAIAAALLGLLADGRHLKDLDGLIDTAVVVVVVMLVQWEFGLSAMASDPSVPVYARAVWMLYPALDSVILALVVRAAMTRRLAGVAAMLVAVGALCWFASDFAYMLVDGADIGGWVDAGWLIGSMALAAGACHRRGWVARTPDEPGVAGRRELGSSRVLIAIAPLVVPGIIDLVGSVQGRDPDPVPLVVATLLLVLLAAARAVRLLLVARRAWDTLESSRRYALALAANSADAVAVLDADGTIVSDGSALAALVGYPEVDVRGLNTRHVLAPLDLDEALSVFTRALSSPGRVFEAEARARHRDGHEMWLSVRIVNLLDDPDVAGIVANVHDVTDRKLAEDALTYQAFHDGATGLANRALFSDRVQHALRRTTRSGTDPAVIFMDLDGFKTVNDSLGHGPGDELLRQVALRLTAAVRDGDTVARLGGDEFGVLIEQSHRPIDEAEAVAERILQALSTPVILDGQPITVSASLGIAVGDAGATAASLLRDADVAMYRAKTSGKGRSALYESDMRTVAVERLQLESDLATALELQQLTLAYQPVIELETERIVGFEALLRWNHPTLGVVPPAKFIPIAENLGLIVPIGAWVLTEACTTAARWHRAYPNHADLSIAINVSARQIASADLLVHVAEAIATSGIDPAQVVLEMTETALVQDTVVAAGRLRELRRLGIRLAIDDFGTGYSSLSYLRQFPVDILKIDRSFIESITDRAGLPPIVRGLLDLGRTLRLEMVAEGVETAIQRDQLRDQRCDHAQGFLFAPALHPDDAEALLLSGGAAPGSGGGVTGFGPRAEERDRDRGGVVAGQLAVDAELDGEAGKPERVAVPVRHRPHAQEGDVVLGGDVRHHGRLLVLGDVLVGGGVEREETLEE